MAPTGPRKPVVSAAPGCVAFRTVARTVTLVLVDGAGAPLGSLPPFDVDMPWWPEAHDIVAGARARWGVDVAVLRLLHADRRAQPGGHVTYVAELTSGGPVPLAPIPADLADAAVAPHPLRSGWARPGGPARSVAWARATLAAAGRPATAITQRKTWNLSALWLLDTAAGPVWLKQVPPFFASEPAVLHWVATAAPGSGPTLLAHADGRMLLEHIPGEDRFDATAAEVALMLADLHVIQADAAKRRDELGALGLADRRPESVPAGAAGLVERHRAGLAAATARALDLLLETLPDRLAEVAGCGLPETLVHGDFHPGNVRGDGRRRVIIDWADAGIGHPAQDIDRATEALPDADAVPLIAAWADRWRAYAPGSDPRRALALLRPVLALQAALAYADFLDHIEPSEWPYHRDDVPHHLTRAAALAMRP